MNETHNAETGAAKVIRMTMAEFADCDFTFNDIFSGNAEKIKDLLRRRRESIAALGLSKLNK